MALIQKSFSDIITFSRSSNATRVGPTGVLEYAPHNLLLQSQTFQTTWTSDPNRGSITADAAAAPDGTVTADKLLAGSDNYGYRFQSPTILNSTVYTVSVYFKVAELTFGWIEPPGASPTYFNLTTGVISSLGSGATATITSVGNGWYRCAVTFTSNSTSGRQTFGVANASGSQVATNGSGIYAWGAQLALGPYALDYVPTTSAAVYGPRFDYDGSGVTIVEPVSTNLVLHSQEFENASWTKGNATVTANAIAAPDGSVTADKFLEDNSTGEHLIYQAASFTASNVNTFSIYVKAAERSVVRISAGSTARWGARAFFDVLSGTVTSVVNGSASIQSVGNGWYRCVLTGSVLTTGSTNVEINLVSSGTTINYAGTTGSGLYLWGAQLEVGSTATAYMVSGASNGFRAVPVVSGSATPKGLLVEEQRQNLLLQSQTFETSWTNTRTTETVNATTAPDGTVTADKLVEDTSASNDHVINQTATVSTSTTYTYSVFIKASERTWAFLNMVDVGISSYRSWFNLSTGVVGTSDTGNTASIQSVGNGWYRCIVSRATTGSQTSMRCEIGLSTGDNVINYTGNGTSGFFIWGAQLEAGSFATSYIPTLASAVTRSADVASVNTLSPWFNATEGTIYTEAQYSSATQLSTFYLGDGTTDNAIWVGKNVGGSGTTFAEMYVRSGGANQGFPVYVSNVIGSTAVKIAATYKANDFRIAAQNILGTTDTTGTIPACTQALIGQYLYSNDRSQHIKRIAYYPRALTNAELQALTS